MIRIEGKDKLWNGVLHITWLHPAASKQSYASLMSYYCGVRNHAFNKIYCNVIRHWRSCHSRELEQGSAANLEPKLYVGCTDSVLSLTIDIQVEELLSMPAVPSL